MEQAPFFGFGRRFGVVVTATVGTLRVMESGLNLEWFVFVLWHPEGFRMVNH